MLFEGAVSKDVVSRAWRKVRTDWAAWSARDLHDEDIVRLILDGTVVRAKIDRKATAISLLVAIGVRRDGQKVLLALRNMGGESTAAWTALLEDMTRRGLKAPEFIIAAMWTLRRHATMAMSALISSKVNQWTLLIGTISVVYSISAGRIWLASVRRQISP